MDAYQDTLVKLSEFIVANAPAGAERELEDLKLRLAEGRPKCYINLEFRRPDASCHLYVDLNDAWVEVVEDAEGNRWREPKLQANASWPSHGSANVKLCQERLALITEVVRFAAELERVFPDPVRKLVSTKAERDERAAAQALDNARIRVKSFIRANSKGMRVGQERRAEPAHGEPDFLPVGTVELDDRDRHYTAHVTATRAFYFTRTK